MRGRFGAPMRRPGRGSWRERRAYRRRHHGGRRRSRSVAALNAWPNPPVAVPLGLAARPITRGSTRDGRGRAVRQTALGVPLAVSIARRLVIVRLRLVRRRFSVARARVVGRTFGITRPGAVGL